jgi:hypothetical protein
LVILDCDGDGRVAVNELVLGVNIGLERVALSMCLAFDADRSGTASSTSSSAGWATP